MNSCARSWTSETSHSKVCHNVIQLPAIQCQVNGCFVNKNIIRENIVSHDVVNSDNGIHYARASTTLILAILMLFPAFAQAELQNVAISGDVNQLITLNLSQSISNISEPVVTIPVQPSSGTATVVGCTDGAQVCVEYQPAVNYAGQESFEYAVVNDQNITETATITINVGNVALPNQGSSPGVVTNNALTGICLDQTRTYDLCAQFRVATESGVAEDLREFIDATSPTNVGAQSALNDELTKEQLSNVSRRLTALRRGQNLTLLSDLNLNYDNNRITGDMFDQLLQDNASGGSAGSGLGKNQEWFISGKIGGGTQDETIYETGFGFDSYALTIGSDYRFADKGLMGWALGYGQTNMDVDHKGGGMDIGNYNGTFYGSYYPSDNSYIDAIGVITRSHYEMQRRVVFGSTDETAKGDTDSTGYAISVGGGYDFVRRGFTSTLNARLDYLRTTIDRYQETNAGSYNIAINKQQVSQLVSTVGAQLRYAFSYSWGVLVPHFNISWLHQLQGDANKVKGNFLVDPNTQFSFETNSPSVNYYVLALGASATFADGVSSYLQYETTVAQDNLTVWNVAAGLRFEW